MIIDAHNHAGWYYMTADKMVANMDAYGIDQCWLLSCEIPEHEYGNVEHRVCEIFGADRRNMPFEHCVAYAEKYPDRFILGYAPDPRMPYALDHLKYAVKAYGVRVCGEIKYRMMADNCDAVQMYRYCGEAGLPVVVHIQSDIPLSGKGYSRSSYWYGGDIFTLERTLQLCPDTNIMGHSTTFWAAISGDDLWKTKSYPRGPVVPGGHLERLLEKYPNLYCDCSGDSGLWALERDPEYTKKLLLTYPDRFIFARDGFTNQLSEFIDTLGLSQDVLENFYHRNIERLIGE